MNRLKAVMSIMVMLYILTGCTHNNLIDTNDAMPENSWTYAKSTKTTVEITDVSKTYQLYFKLRHTSDYRYSNLFVIMRLKGEGINQNTRYQFKVAKTDGEWLGKGSGDIFTSNFALLKDYRFLKPGKYNIEIEQNMRDNPLTGISDVGITLKSN